MEHFFPSFYPAVEAAVEVLELHITFYLSLELKLRQYIAAATLKSRDREKEKERKQMEFTTEA